MNSTSVNGCSVVGRLVVLPILIRSRLVRIPASHPGAVCEAKTPTGKPPSERSALMIQLSGPYGFCGFSHFLRQVPIPGKKRSKTAAMKSGDFIADADFILYTFLLQMFCKGCCCQGIKGWWPET